MNVKNAVIIPAAGLGKRMKSNTNKLLLNLGTSTVLDLTIKKFQDCSSIHFIILVVSKESLPDFKNYSTKFSKILAIIEGGKERTNSVINGFNALPNNIDNILIHDAARPFVSTDIINRVLSKLNSVEVVTAAMPVKDTIKIVDDNLNVLNTPERSKLWLTQTPQGFKKNILNKLIKDANKNSIVFTDECQLAEKVGIPVSIIEGDYTNFKITTAEDILFARALVNNNI